MASSSLILIVTGASRGLGRSIALAFGRQLLSYDHMVMVLVGRSLEGLTQTKDLLRSQCPPKKSLETHALVMDLSQLNELECFVEQKILPILSLLSSSSSSSNNAEKTDFIFVNNAGSLGPVGPCTLSHAFNLQNIQSTIDFNVSSALYLSARLAAHAKNAAYSHSTLIHISSLVAVQPFPTLALYSAGKAARNAYHVALAQEEKEWLKVLNYAPGPLETTMTEEIRQSSHLSADLQPQYAKKLVHPDDSAQALVDYYYYSIIIPTNNNYESGQHIDYYDLASSSSSSSSSKA